MSFVLLFSLWFRIPSPVNRTVGGRCRSYRDFPATNPIRAQRQPAHSEFSGALSIRILLQDLAGPQFWRWLLRLQVSLPIFCAGWSKTPRHIAICCRPKRTSRLGRNERTPSHSGSSHRKSPITQMRQLGCCGEPRPRPKVADARPTIVVSYRSLSFDRQDLQKLSGDLVGKLHLESASRHLVHTSAWPEDGA